MVTFGHHLKNSNFLLLIMGENMKTESHLLTTRNNFKSTWKKFLLRKFSPQLTLKQMNLLRFINKLSTLMEYLPTRRLTLPFMRV
jgi:hypothetical protein